MLKFWYLLELLLVEKFWLLNHSMNGNLKINIILQFNEKQRGHCRTTMRRKYEISVSLRFYKIILPVKLKCNRKFGRKELRRRVSASNLMMPTALMFNFFESSLTHTFQRFVMSKFFRELILIFTVAFHDTAPVKFSLVHCKKLLLPITIGLYHNRECFWNQIHLLLIQRFLQMIFFYEPHLSFLHCFSLISHLGVSRSTILESLCILLNTLLTTFEGLPSFMQFFIVFCVLASSAFG